MASAKVSRMPEPPVMFKKFGDSALEFELHVWIHDIDERTQGAQCAASGPGKAFA